jgi:hypothetical protein
VVVLRCLREVCCEGQLLVDLFVNYDCDLNSSNIFERLINGLVRRGVTQRMHNCILGAADCWGALFQAMGKVCSLTMICLETAFLFDLCTPASAAKSLALSRASPIICRPPPLQVKMAQAPLTQGADHTAVQQEQWLRQEALQVPGVRARGGGGGG